MKDLYRPLYLIETPVVITNVVTAEGDQVGGRRERFLATKIRSSTEIADLCEKGPARTSTTVARGHGAETNASAGNSSPAGPG